MTPAMRALWADAGVVVGVLVALVALRKPLIGAFRWVRRWFASFGVKERRAAELSANVARLMDDVRIIKQEVRYNGGSSVKDMLVQLRTDMHIERAARRMANGRATWEGRRTIDGRFECAHVSPEWVRLTGQTRETSDNGGWLLAVDPLSRTRVSAEMDEAGEAMQLAYSDYVCVNVLTGERTSVRHLVVPVMGLDQSGHRQVVSWLAELVIQPEPRGKTS